MTSSYISCSTTIPATVARSLVIPFQIECVPRLALESRAVFCRKAARLAQGHLVLLDPRDLAAPPTAFTKQVTRAYPQTLLLPFPRLSNSGAVVKSVVSIAAKMLMSLARVLPCVPPELYFSYYMHIHCSILELPVLYFRSPDVATKKHG